MRRVGKLHKWCIVLLAGAMLSAAFSARGEKAGKPVPPLPPQVAISVTIIEVAESHSRELGMQMFFRGDDDAHPSSVLDGGFINLPFTAPNVSVPLGTNIGGSGYRESRAPGAGITLLGLDTNYGAFEARLRALMSRDEAEIKAQPIVVTLSGEEAIISTTDQIPYVDIVFDSKKKSDSLAQAEKGVGITLEVKPTVIDPEKGVIDLDVKRVEISNVTNYIVTRGVQRPLFSRSAVENTSVVLKDGEGLMIGGLASKRRRNVEYKVPVLGSIPILGYFFKQTRTSMEDSRVMFLITPFILKPGENPQLPPDFIHGDEVESLQFE